MHLKFNISLYVCMPFVWCSTMHQICPERSWRAPTGPTTFGRFEEPRGRPRPGMQLRVAGLATAVNTRWKNGNLRERASILNVSNGGERQPLLQSSSSLVRPTAAVEVFCSARSTQLVMHGYVEARTGAVAPASASEQGVPNGHSPMGSGAEPGHGDGAAAAETGCPAEAGSEKILAEEIKDGEDATLESSSSSASTAKRPRAPPPAVPIPALESDSESDSVASSSESDEVMADLLSRMRDMLRTSRRDSEHVAPAPPPSRLASLDVAGVAGLILSGKVKNIVVMCGAGMSVSAGIPDFRTPGTGLYARLAEYKLPHPQAIFEIDYFRQAPQPFFHLARHLFPGTYLPTPAHHFLVLLHAKGLLTRIYTQNIDSLEVQAGLPPSIVVPAHGNFDSARCIDCRAPHEVQHVRDAVFGEEDGVARCNNKSCNGLVKPDIVMFGEDLPKRFFELLKVDFPKADLLIVLGTSLIVHPFASLIDHVKPDVPRVLINREVVGEPEPALRLAGYAKGFDFSSPQRHRDVLMLGDCDDRCRELARLLNWEADLDARIEAAVRQWRKEKPDGAAEAAA